MPSLQIDYYPTYYSLPFFHDFPKLPKYPVFKG